MFFQFLLACLVYNSIIRVQQTNINIDDQVAWDPSNQNFAIQFKWKLLPESFVLKVAALGPHLIIL